jgi:hypothetical protein
LAPTCTSQNIRNKYNKQKINCNYNFQQLCVHYNFDLIIIILIRNNSLEKESVFNEKILKKYVNNIVYMFYQTILKFRLHENQCENFSLIFNTTNDLDNGWLRKLYGLKRWTDNNFFVASWNHNLMIGFSSLGSSMILGAWVFVISLKRDVCNPKYPLKVGQKLMNWMYWVFLVYNNVIWMSLNELQK